MGKCLSFLASRRDYRSDAYTEIVSLMWAKHCRSPYSLLSTNVLREVNSYLAAVGLLVDLQGRYLRFYSFRTRTWSANLPLKKLINVDAFSSSWVLLDSYNIFVCGGAPCKVYTDMTHKGWNSAYIVHAKGAVEDLPAMHTVRAYHGLILWRNSVFVFGGSVYEDVNLRRREAITGSERYQVFATMWQFVQPMAIPRANFNPCLFHEIIYLSSWIIEGYSPARNTYIDYQVKLPGNPVRCVYVDSSELVVHTEFLVIRFEMGSNGVLAETSSTAQRHHGHYVRTCCPPVVDAAAGVLHFVHCGQHLLFFMDGGRIKNETEKEFDPVPYLMW